MSRKKILREVKGHRTKAEIARRKEEEAASKPVTVAEPFAAQVESLDDLLAAIRAERSTFDGRLKPAETVCYDSSGPYAWPEGDAAEIARSYAREIVDGVLPAGELIKCAAKRFLAALDAGTKRGLYFDPVAARNAVAFVEKFCGLSLIKWQVWVICEIFGWKKPTGMRRFTEAWLSMARKNGKTHFASAVALFLLVADQEKYAEIYSASVVKENSRIVWNDARRAVASNPELSAAVKRWAGKLEIETSGCEFKPLASEEDSFLGTRPHGIICDEVGVWSDRNAFDVLMQGTVSRRQSLCLGITTAPSDKKVFCYEKFTWVERILKGVIEADHVFAAIYRIDDGDDPKDLVSLRKANPSLGITLFEEALQKQISELSETPSGLNNWLQFHCNQTPERSINALPSITSEAWDRCVHFELLPTARDPRKAMDEFIPMNKGKFVWLGLDAGTTDDMFAVAFLWRSAYLTPHKRNDRGAVTEWAEAHPKRFCLVDYFMPEAGILEKERKWRIPLSTWVREKFITLTPGDMVDDRIVREYSVEEIAKRFCVNDCGFDNWQLKTLMAEINDRKVFSCTAVPQTCAVLTPAIKALKADIQRGDLVHFNNPVLKWNAENVYFGENDDTIHGGLRPQKCGGDRTLKIDGISALLNAYQRMLSAPPEISGQVYAL